MEGIISNQILSNHKISKKVDTSDEWIKSRTGISQRRISGLSDNVSEMGYKAAMAAIEMAKWDVETIDLIILATSTPNDLFGSAPEIQSKLGANNACLLYTSPSPRDQRGSRMPSSA